MNCSITIYVNFGLKLNYIYMLFWGTLTTTIIETFMDKS